jgi:hypothetical protein
MDDNLFKTPILKNKNYISYLTNPLKYQIYEVKIKNIQKLKSSNGYIITIYIPNDINNNLYNELIKIDEHALNSILINNNKWFKNNLEEDELKKLYKSSYCKQTNTLNILISDTVPINININNKYHDNINEVLDILLDLRNLKNYIINIEVQHIGLYIYSEISTNKWIVKDINILNIEHDKCSWNREDIENSWESEVNNINELIENKIVETNNYIDNLIKYRNNVNNILKEAKNMKNADKNWETKLNELKKNIIVSFNRILSTNDNR